MMINDMEDVEQKEAKNNFFSREIPKINEQNCVDEIMLEYAKRTQIMNRENYFSTAHSRRAIY